MKMQQAHTEQFVFLDSRTGTIIDFLTGIGIVIRTDEIHQTSFLPGILIDHGTLVIDPAKLLYPGDLLHEAGHLAVMPADRRRRVHIDVGRDAAEEMMAIAWSYAALVHLKLDPAIVFHPDGYRGGSQALIKHFSNGRYIGVPVLQWLGMTADEKRAQELGVAPFPHMLKWLRDE